LQPANVTLLDSLLIPPEEIARSQILIVLPITQQLVSDREDGKGHVQAVLPAAGAAQKIEVGATDPDVARGNQEFSHLGAFRWQVLDCQLTRSRHNEGRMLRSTYPLLRSIGIHTCRFTPDAPGALVQHLQAYRGQVRYTGLG
jgi:hypothetical protein